MTGFSLINNDPWIFQLCCFLVVKSCPTLCDHMNCSPALQALLSVGFPTQEYWSGLPFPSPRHLLRPGLKPASPSLAGGFVTTRKAWSSDYLGFCVLFFFFCKSLSVLLTHLFRAVAQRYLRGCLLSVSPQKIHRIKHDSQLFGCAFFSLFLTEG